MADNPGPNPLGNGASPQLSEAPLEEEQPPVQEMPAGSASLTPSTPAAPGSNGSSTDGAKSISALDQSLIGGMGLHVGDILDRDGDEQPGSDNTDTVLITGATLAPLAAAMAVITAYCGGLDPYLSLAIGAVAGIVALLGLRAIYTFRNYKTASRACVSVYNMMCHRMYYAVQVQGPLHKDAEIARVQREGERGVDNQAEVFCTTREKKGLHWALGQGYLDLYTSVLRAEESLLLYEPIDLVTADAVLVKARLTGSDLSDRDEQLDRVRHALGVLNPATTPYLPADPSRANGAQPPSPGTGESGKVPSDDIIAARVMLQKAWYAVNEYRQTRLLRLLKLRDELLFTMFLSQLTTLVLLSLVIQAHPRREAVLTGAVLYGLGVIVGLFNHLAITVKAEALGIDFGITTVQLFQITCLSGIAAVIGVYITLELPAALNSGLLSGSGTGTTGATAIVPISQIYDLNRYPFEAVLALIFGLTPRLLITRLTAALKQNKEELQSTDMSNTQTEKSEFR